MDMFLNNIMNLKPCNGKLCIGHRKSLQGMLLGVFGTKRWKWGPRSGRELEKVGRRVFKAAVQFFFFFFFNPRDCKAATVFLVSGTRGSNDPIKP